MTPRSRCLAALAGEPVDRIPAYTPTIACDVASKLLGRAVHTGSPTLWYALAAAHMRGGACHAELSAAVDEALIDLNRALGIEVIRFGYRHDRKPTLQLDARTFLYGDPDGVHEVWQYEPDSMNFHRTAQTAPEPDPDQWPALAARRLAGVEAGIQRVRETAGVWEQRLQERLGDEMLVAAPGGSFSVGLDAASLMACLIHPGAVAEMLDAQLELALATAETLAARGIRVVLGGGDMADKHGTMYSPAVFRDLMLPRLARFAARCRELGLHYVWRSDGNVWGIADMLFQEAGIPGFGEVDFDAGMTARDLRRSYPELTLWANASGDVIRRRDAAAVYDHCLEILSGAGPTRHFHGCSNTVLPGSPPENVQAMMRARDDYSRSLPPLGVTAPSAHPRRG